MIVASMCLLNRLTYDVLAVVDLALARVLAEAIEIFDSKCYHVGLLRAHHL